MQNRTPDQGPSGKSILIVLCLAAVLMAIALVFLNMHVGFDCWKAGLKVC